MNLFIFDLKSRSKEIIRTARPSPTGIGLVYILITFVLTYLGNRNLLINFTDLGLKQYQTYLDAGNFEYAYLCLESMMPPSSAYPISMLLTAVSSLVQAGFIIFIINTVRNNNACIGNLMDGFAIFWRILLLYIVEGVLVFLQLLLLVAPGVIAFYSYRMALYLLIDHREWSVFQCIKESRRMMKGHKAELLGLDISFIGWYLLNNAPLFGYAARTWSVPFISTAQVLFYEKLCGHDIYAAINTEPRKKKDDGEAWM